MFADLIKCKVKRRHLLLRYITQCIFPRHAPTILMEVRCTLNINFAIRVHCVRTNFKYFMWLSSATQFVFSLSLSFLLLSLYTFSKPTHGQSFLYALSLLFFIFIFFLFTFSSSASSSWTHKLASLRFAFSQACFSCVNKLHTRKIVLKCMQTKHVYTFLHMNSYIYIYTQTLLYIYIYMG